MEKVYVVECVIPYDGSSIVGVFSTKEKAEEYIMTQVNSSSFVREHDDSGSYNEHEIVRFKLYDENIVIYYFSVYEFEVS